MMHFPRTDSPVFLLTHHQPISYMHNRDALKLHDENVDEFKTLMAKGHVTMEAAFNLSAIYQASNNKELAAHIAQKYLRVEC